MNWKKIIIPVAILVFGFILMQFLFSLKTEPPKKAKEVRARFVDTETLVAGDVNSEIVAFGRLQSAQPVILTSEVAGIIEQGDIPFQPGQSFKKGDLLVKIDNRQAWLNLNSAKSDFLNALATVLPEIKVDFPGEYPKWEAYFNSCNFGQKMAALPATDNQKIKLYLSRFNVYKLFFTVQNLEILLEKHYFHAPFDGSIVSADLRLGSSVRNGTRLGEIINLTDLEVEVPVPAADVQWINREKAVQFTSSEVPGNWSGKIVRIGKNIDERTQTVPVFIKVDRHQGNHLYEGVFLKAVIPGRTIKNAVSVPRKSIYNEHYIYLIKDGKLDYRKASVVRRQTNSVIIDGGFESGDTLVTELMQGVAAGMPAKSRTQVPDGGQN